MGQQHVSSRPMTIEVRIPQDQAGIVIGRGGQTIKEIQSRSNTRIHFKDELSTKDFRTLAIIGQIFWKLQMNLMFLKKKFVKVLPARCKN